MRALRHLCKTAFWRVISPLKKEDSSKEAGKSQLSDAYAEKFAREELNLIFEDEQYLSFKDNNPDEPKK